MFNVLSTTTSSGATQGNISPRMYSKSFIIFYLEISPVQELKRVFTFSLRDEEELTATNGRQVTIRFRKPSHYQNIDLQKNDPKVLLTLHLPFLVRIELVVKNYLTY